MTARPNHELEKELLGLERSYWQAIRDGDLEGALALTDNPCTVTGAQGVATVDHKAMSGMMKAGTWTLKDFSFSEETVRVLCEDVAVVAYKVHEDLVVDGGPRSLDAGDASTWIRRNGRWVCTLHTESLLGDPLGREHRTKH